MSRLLALLAALLVAACAISPLPVQIAPASTTCAIYTLAYEYAHSIQPGLTVKQSQDIRDALKLDACNATFTSAAAGIRDSSTIPQFPDGAIFVDPLSGRDTNIGTQDRPLRSLLAAQTKARASSEHSTVVLRNGTHYLNATLELTSLDSGLTIRAYPGEDATISGATVLSTPAWEPYRVSSTENIYVAHNVVAPPGFSGLRVNGKRAIRARWPNGDPEYQLFPNGWESSAVWGAPKRFSDAISIVVNSPNRSDEAPCNGDDSSYCNYATGVGGACAGYGYEPPSGYWCQTAPSRGKQYSTAWPSTLELQDSAFEGRVWKHFRANETVVNAFRTGHWFNYVFLVDEYDSANRTISWTHGGFQGGEGDGSAAEWNVENSFDELDFANEWYYDTVNHSLYYFHNATGPPLDAEFEAVYLEELITISGGGTAVGETAPHVQDVTIQGVKITGAALTTLAPHGLPSDGGGDWAIARRGAVHITGAENVTLQDCIFERVDGNAIMISGYARNITVRGNEFHLIGENGVVSWGYTADFPDQAKLRPVQIPTGQGPDARDGNHPQGTLLEANIFHEIGHFQKQVSCYFQAQSQGATLRNNICYNGPRAGINFNDGMGGGALLERNLIFNMVRETQDHGSFNSWDRQPFFVLGDNGEGTFKPKFNEIKGNFWINDYNPQEAVDNDDGSSYYHTHHNFFALSTGGLKSDFGGHDNLHHDNIYYVKGQCVGICAQTPGHLDGFFNNTCISNSKTPSYASFDRASDQLPIMHDNRVYTQDGTAVEAGRSIESWQAIGHDLGTTVHTLPTDSDLVQMVKMLLEL